MHTHAIEMQHIVQTALQGQHRFNLYAGIHKALRALMGDTLIALGRADPDDDADVAHAAGRVIELLDVCVSHVRHENDFVHAALEARCPGAARAVSDDHVHHLRHIAHLRDAARSLPGVPTDQRSATLLALYQTLALFVAENFTHMHVEETVHNAALWSAFSDLELVAIHDALVGSIPPEEMVRLARWLLPNLNATERAMLVNDMQTKAPPPAVQAILDVARPHLSERDWAKLRFSANLPAQPA